MTRNRRNNNSRNQQVGFADLCEHLRGRILDLLPTEDRAVSRLVCKDFATTPVRSVRAGNGTHTERLLKCIAAAHTPRGRRRLLRPWGVRRLEVCSGSNKFPDLLGKALASPSSSVEDLVIGSILNVPEHNRGLVQAAGGKGVRRLTLGSVHYEAKALADKEAGNVKNASASHKLFRGTVILDTPGAFDDLEELTAISIHDGSLEMHVSLPKLRTMRLHRVADVVIRALVVPNDAVITLDNDVGPTRAHIVFRTGVVTLTIPPGPIRTCTMAELGSAAMQAIRRRAAAAAAAAAAAPAAAP